MSFIQHNLLKKGNRKIGELGIEPKRSSTQMKRPAIRLSSEYCSLLSRGEPFYYLSLLDLFFLLFFNKLLSLLQLCWRHSYAAYYFSNKRRRLRRSVSNNRRSDTQLYCVRRGSKGTMWYHQV